MNTTDPLSKISTNRTPQTQSIPGRNDQVLNNAEGYVFEISPIKALIRFLTIGTTGGTYYVGEDKLSKDAADMIISLTKTAHDHKILVNTIVDVSLAGRAKKQHPTLFALAIACQLGDTEGKQYARKRINQVVRTGTHLFLFTGYLQQFGGWPMGLRKAVAKWYTEKDSDKLAYQLVKYRQREGWTHRDVLRLTHPKIEAPASRAAIDWAVHGTISESSVIPKVISGHILANEPKADVPKILETYDLPWESLPDSAMNDPEVWHNLLANGVPLGALLRQLPRLTRIGVIGPMQTEAARYIINQLTDSDNLKRARIHPFSILVAMRTYASGQGRGVNTWSPVPQIIDALDDAYYASFGHITPAGKRTMNALDVSGSMGWDSYEHLGGMNAREISAAMAMVTVKTEPAFMTVGFTGNHGLSNLRGKLLGGFGHNLEERELQDPISILPISSRQRLDDVIDTISNLSFGITDCAQPMLFAIKERLEIDTFVIYTDSETYAGNIHPSQALKKYRQVSGIDAKLVVVAATPTMFSIADPNDPGMLDVSGFDSATPQLISDFSAGII